LAIPDVRDVLVGDLAVSGNWLARRKRTDKTGDRTITAQHTRYCDEDILILPLMNGLFPSVAMNALERLSVRPEAS